MRYLFSGLIALALGGCQTTDYQPAPPPTIDQQSIIPPASDVPEKYAVFSGEWRGEWILSRPPAQPSSLVVQTVNADGSVTGTYAVGDTRLGTIKAHGGPVAGRIEDKTLVLDQFPRGAHVTYTLQPDGSLKGRYSRGGILNLGRFVKIGGGAQ